MTLLSDRDIYREMSRRNIVVTPFNQDSIQPASYDVHLDDTILTPIEPIKVSWWQRLIGIKPPYAPTYFDPLINTQPLKSVQLFTREQENTTGEHYYLPPGSRALGCTQELLTISHDAPIAADIAGCSSLGRWWLFVHVTAGFIDPGWTGRLTLELYNASPWWIRIWAGMRIAQLRFYELRNTPNVSYLDIGHYAGATTVLPANYKG